MAIKKTYILKHFGERVRNLRKAQGLSQEELAEKAELHYTYIGGVERGERNLSLKSIERIAAALKVDIKDIFIFHPYRKTEAKGHDIINDINRLLLDKDVSILKLIKLVVNDIDMWTRGMKAKQGLGK